MNEYISEETPYNNIPHNHALAIKICKGLRPNIFNYTPKLLADLITKCWDAKAENRPTAKELHQTLKPVNSDVTKTTLHSECFDCQLDELDLNEINQDEENNIE
ncbi:unnamed protein product [Rhizophagus irregularis]|uniref:Serine-threonine/tyrosine-protein kinase catalytic domain-containing protein n=1 Tax=Rhizophagus irregularis TaxID=588596 RepID=A0A916E9L0_9GLOM|nr:unnamed protein product [Rhizophagus irregularis]